MCGLTPAESDTQYHVHMFFLIVLAVQFEAVSYEMLVLEPLTRDFWRKFRTKCRVALEVWVVEEILHEDVAFLQEV